MVEVTTRDYKIIFEEAPVAIWDEDFTEVMNYINGLNLEGNDLSGYLTLNPEKIIEAASRVIIKDVNQEALKMFKASTKDEFINDITKCFTEKSIEAFKKELVSLYSGEMNFKINANLKNLKGEEMDVLIQYNCIRANDNDYSRILISMVDITEKTSLEKELKQKEIKYQELFDNAPMGILISNPEKKINNFNDQMKHILGYSDEEMKQLSLPDLLHPDEVEIHKKDYARLIKGEIIVSKRRMMMKDGSYKPVQLTATLLKNGSIQGLVIDLSKEKEEESRREEIEERIKLILENFPILLWMIDEKGYSTFIEGKIAENLDIKKYQLQQSTVYELFSNYPEIIAAINSVMNGETVSKIFEVGGYFYDNYIKPITNQNGDVISILGISMDITEQQIASQQFHQSQKMDAIGRLAGGINHDFNNILMAILGYTDIITSESDINVIKDDVMEIKHAALRGAALTNQLSSLTRKDVAEKRKVDLCIIISGMNKLLSRLIDESINFRVNVPQVPCFIFADGGKVEQAVMNLIINAKEAIVGQGIISLEVSKIRLLETLITRFNNLPPGNYIKVVVRDNGTGIKKKNLEKIFEPFYTSKDQGTGLGLSIVFGILEETKGAIEIATEEGLGTEFILYFPEYVGESKVVTPRVPLNRSFEGRLNILLIDDEELILRSIGRLLERENHVVFTALGHKEAIKIWDENLNNIDLVITDIIMPEISGIDLSAKFLSQKENIKIIYISGYPGDYLSDKGIDVNDISFLHKPFNKLELQEMIKSIMV